MVTTRVTLPLLLFSVLVRGSFARTRYLVKTNSNASDLFKTRNEYLKITQEPIAVTKSPLYGANTKLDGDIGIPKQSTEFERRSSYGESSTFNPDILNKFLEEYASKMKTDKPYKNPFTIVKTPAEPLTPEVEAPSSKLPSASTLKINSTKHRPPIEDSKMEEGLNDTLKRNKNWNAGPQDDRNGWVTLEAIPWSKSKISKWQANQNTQRPWPEQKPWEKPYGENPSFDYPTRPSHESSRPWQERPKPYATSQRPWYQPDQHSPAQPSRPSYFDDNKFDSGPSYTQKWPPERTWNKHSESSRPSADIIVDDTPANFPGSWDKPQSSKPDYVYDRISVGGHDENGGDWKAHGYHFPSTFEELNKRPSGNSRPTSFDRPHFSQYRYTTEHPSSHPSTGDGKWVLLSTNRGYSKSRQRSIKIDSQSTENPAILNRKIEKVKNSPVETMTSKRQVRLTVLPSVNGTNTTTSHGGLLEVEKTFKTVDQSQEEYERDKQTTDQKNRPIRHALKKQQPSNEAVLAAVGVGMLPATMAMVIPMILGRKKRAVEVENDVKRSLDLGDELGDMADRLNDSKTWKALRM